MKVSPLFEKGYRMVRRVIAIGQIPRKIKGFKPRERHLAPRAWNHYRGLVLVMTIGHRSAIDRLAKLLRGWVVVFLLDMVQFHSRQRAILPVLKRAC